MSIQIRDGISPALKRVASKLQNRKPLLQAMGLQLASLTQRAFRESNLRPTAWPDRKKPASHNLLLKKGTLWKSIRITEVTNDSVTVGSDRLYAAVQQFGSKKAKGRGGGIPARPFFPFDSSGKMTPLATAKIEAVIRDKISKLIGS